MRMQNEWIVYQTDDADELEEAEEEVKDVVQAVIELYLVKIFISEEELRRNCERMEETWKIHKGWCIAKGEEDNFSFLFLSNKLWRWRGGWTIQMRWWWWCQSIKEIWLYTYFHNFLFWFILLGSFFLFQRPLSFVFSVCLLFQAPVAVADVLKSVLGMPHPATRNTLSSAGPRKGYCLSLKVPITKRMRQSSSI